MNPYTWTYQYWPTKQEHLHQLCAGTGCNLEDLPGVMDNRDRWRERIREIRASRVT